MPSVLEYVCPDCGGKTVYGYDYSSSFYALQDIASARQIFAGLDSVSELEMSLDESSFCSECRSDSTGDPALVLRIVWDDGSTHEAPVSLEDLRMLTGFLSGGLEYSTSNDGTVPLKTGLDHLRELLGV